jgi:hypothetical protein
MFTLMLISIKGDFDYKLNKNPEELKGIEQIWKIILYNNNE